MQLAAPGKRDFHFDLALLEVELGGNHGQALLLDARGKQMNFAVMQQQLLVSVGLLKHVSAALIRSDAHADDEGFSVSAFDKAVAEADLPGTDAFYFRSGKNYAGLEELQKFVVLAGFAVINARRVGHGMLQKADVGNAREGRRYE